MYMTRAHITGTRGAMLAGRGEYGAHQALWDLFADGPDRKRDFLYRRLEGAEPGFLCLSQRPPQTRGPGWNVETKPFEPVLEKGDRLGFSLRANPVRSARDENGKQSRHDVVMDAKWRLREEDARLPVSQIAADAGSAWLFAREQSLGIAVDRPTLKVDGYRQHLFHKRRRRIRIATLDFSGFFTVEDPEALRAAVFSGIGPAKAFGCGLLLLRRA